MNLKRQLLVYGVLLWAIPAWAQTERKYPVDPQTERAIDAKEMTPAALKSKLGEGNKTLLVDVRSREAYEKETIPGAIYVPYEGLAEWLKTVPKDTQLVFT
jgi:3-mercaptopyruvate sulfurtransferase SseA